MEFREGQGALLERGFRATSCGLRPPGQRVVRSTRMLLGWIFRRPRFQEDKDLGQDEDGGDEADGDAEGHEQADRKSTRLNSSHLGISYAVFCLKKKN